MTPIAVSWRYKLRRRRLRRLSAGSTAPGHLLPVPDRARNRQLHASRAIWLRRRKTETNGRRLSTGMTHCEIRRLRSTGHHTRRTRRLTDDWFCNKLMRTEAHAYRRSLQLIYTLPRSQVLPKTRVMVCSGILNDCRSLVLSLRCFAS